MLGVNWDSDSDKLLVDLDSVVAFAKSLPLNRTFCIEISGKDF